MADSEFCYHHDKMASGLLEPPPRPGGAIPLDPKEVKWRKRLASRRYQAKRRASAMHPAADALEAAQIRIRDYQMELSDAETRIAELEADQWKAWKLRVGGALAPDPARPATESDNV